MWAIAVVSVVNSAFRPYILGTLVSGDDVKGLGACSVQKATIITADQCQYGSDKYEERASVFMRFQEELLTVP
ncbi:MAG: hypothetical protein UX89_C0004G0044 [Parcubacteria group bacterium GW2011_GWA2_47_16]|nr:MAG: hypothetical protein UX89_C0004G0044 [Parcubacteria group bacterium GW2011_GWA2_47_16]